MKKMMKQTLLLSSSEHSAPSLSLYLSSYIFFFLFFPPNFSFPPYSSAMEINHENNDGDDEDALSSMSSVPPPRKIHSYSHQLRNSGQKSHHHRQRQHSLDDIPKITEIISGCGISGDSSDDEFYPYATTTNSSSFPYAGGDPGDSDDYLITHQPESGEDFQPLPVLVV